jgi:hypothetical protein
VSLSWRDRYTAVLSPDRVALVRRRRGWGAQPELHSQAECTSNTPQAAVDALTTLLAAPGLGRGDLTVLLSSQFVRYLLVPYQAQIGKPSELAAFAGICFDETFGNDSGGREILVGRERAPSARIAAGLDTSFLHALRTVVAASRLRLVSVQPYLATLFNRLRSSLGRRDFVFLVAEPTRSCLLVATGGCWRSLRNTGAAATPQELANLVEREAQLAGLGEADMPPVFVHAPGQDDLELPSCAGVVPKRIGLKRGAPAASSDPLLAMAMTVA